MSLRVCSLYLLVKDGHDDRRGFLRQSASVDQQLFNGVL